MFIPPVPDIPPVPKEPMFPKAKVTISNKAIGDELRQLCSDLRGMATTPAMQEALLRFREAVTPRGVSDTGRLPVAAKRPRASKPRALSCLYSALSWAIQSYWAQCDHGEDRAEEIQKIMLDIRGLMLYTIGDRAINTIEAALARCQRGINGCQLVGNERDGWTWEVPGE